MTKLISLLAFTFLFQSTGGVNPPELNSRIGCGGCIDSAGKTQVVDVSFKTMVLPKPDGTWTFTNLIQNHSPSLFNMFLIVPWKDCLKKTEGKSTKEIADMGCGVGWGMLTDEQQEMEFAFVASDAKPLESRALLWILDSKGEVFMTGQVTIYWPDKTDPKFQFPTMGGTTRKIPK